MLGMTVTAEECKTLYNYSNIFRFEYCGELFLEYFHIEKCFTTQPVFYMFAGDVIVFCTALYTIIDEFIYMKNDYQKHDNIERILDVMFASL